MTTEKLHHTSEHEEDAPRDMATRSPRLAPGGAPPSPGVPERRRGRGSGLLQGQLADTPERGPERRGRKPSEIVLGVREFMAGLTDREKREAAGAAAGVMALPSRERVTEFRQSGLSAESQSTGARRSRPGRTTWRKRWTTTTTCSRATSPRTRGRDGRRTWRAEGDRPGPGASLVRGAGPAPLQQDPHGKGPRARRETPCSPGEERPSQWPEWMGRQGHREKGQNSSSTPSRGLYRERPRPTGTTRASTWPTP